MSAYEEAATFLPLTMAMDNVHASRVGKVCNKAARASAGDSIDRGLALVTLLDEQGYCIVPKDGNASFFTGSHRPPGKAER